MKPITPQEASNYLKSEASRHSLYTSRMAASLLATSEERDHLELELEAAKKKIAKLESFVNSTPCGKPMVLVVHNLATDSEVVSVYGRDINCKTVFVPPWDTEEKVVGGLFKDWQELYHHYNLASVVRSPMSDPMTAERAMNLWLRNMEVKVVQELYSATRDS